MQWMDDNRLSAVGSVCRQWKLSPLTHAFFVYYENADLVYDIIRMRQLSKQTLHSSYREMTIHKNRCFTILFCWIPRLKQATSTELI